MSNSMSWLAWEHSQQDGYDEDDFMPSPERQQACTDAVVANLMATTNTKTPEQLLQAWADELASKLTPKEAGYLEAALAVKRCEVKK